MKQIDSVTLTEEVTQVNVDNLPADTCFFADLFTRLGQQQINVDMICRPVTHSQTTQLSFTINDHELDQTVAILTELKKQLPQLQFSFSAYNCKIVASSESMRQTPGIAGAVFDAICKADAEILLVSTGETEISILVSEADCEKALQAIKNI